ncbi:MAG: hypothetical protein ACPKPY_11120 [Nitrososphaeraceae archaeon]
MITSLVIAVIAGVIISSIGFAYGIEANSDFLEYEDIWLKINILYPNNWSYSQESSGFNLIGWNQVTFTPHEILEQDNQTTIAGLLIELDKNTYGNPTLKIYENAMIDEIETAFNIKESSLNITDFELAGNDARKLTLKQPNGHMADIIISIHNGNAYRIGYGASPEIYDKYLPVVNKMLDTFEFTN